MHSCIIAAIERRKELVVQRQEVWNRLLKRYVLQSGHAPWLLANPIPPENLFEGAGGDKDIYEEYRKHCHAFLDDLGNKLKEEELLVFHEAFPLWSVLERILKERKFKPRVLVKYNIAEKYEHLGGLLERQPHLKNLPLPEQIPFFPANRSQSLVKLICSLPQDDPHEFCFQYLEGNAYTCLENVEKEIRPLGLSFADFAVPDKEISRLLKLLKRSMGLGIIDFLKISKSHGPAIMQLIELIEVYQQEISSLNDAMP